MPTILAEIANDPRKIGFHDLMIRVGRPEALRVKFLERLAREFKSALPLFRNLFRRVHDIKLVFFKPQTGRQFTGLHTFEMDFERAVFSSLPNVTASLRQPCHPAKYKSACHTFARYDAH